LIAFATTVIVIWGLEGPQAESVAEAPAAAKPTFRAALAQVWSEPQARLFSIFIFVSMLAYSAQDLILEPFAGVIFGLTPGQSTSLSGLQNGGVFTGMIVVAVLGGRFGTPQTWTVIGCLASAAALLGLVVGGQVGAGWPLLPNVFLLGFSNGLYAAAAIASMMALAGQGRAEREGTRMGVWGAAQAIAFGIGGWLGTVAVDLSTHLTGSPLVAYGSVFATEALLFLVAAVLAGRLAARAPDRVAMPAGSGALVHGRG